MAKLVLQIYSDLSMREILPSYDAILVDEGQDYNKDWWQTLQRAVLTDGEMLLVADKTQHIYDNDITWLEESLRGTGISSTWYELKTSYRLPIEIKPILKDFTDNFLIPSGIEVDEPIYEQTELNFDPRVELQWVQVSVGSSVAEACFQAARLQMQHLRDDTAISDVVFLSQNNKLGMSFVNHCAEHMAGDPTSPSAREPVLHTFVDENMDNVEFGMEDKGFRIYENSRRKKLAFFIGDARIKATTLHSFKGWEGRHLILFVNRISSDKDRALFYTALTRLKKHPNGCMLTVVSSCPELREFGYRNFSSNFIEL